MSYQVLARKWRPRTFSELVGQSHVLQALVNALNSGQLHHAYVFTGTRGVGKTTIARILAKALNCEQGVSAEPCLECQTCRDVDAGCFVDLIEIDAASRTKVEDTKEILDNVQYTPAVGRFKIYLIDEVHMLSGHSFNALLKTLEEPPPHVKFLLATTDAHKIPVTVMSRCMPFTLRHLLPGQIVTQLQTICDKEKLAYENQALELLAKAAEGSLRDALSLLDKSIAYSNRQINVASVREMLGDAGEAVLFDILHALCENDAAKLLTISQALACQPVSFRRILGDIIELLHQISVYQCVPSASLSVPRVELADFIESLSKEDVQLFYQIALKAQQDILLAPSSALGFEMALLRMLTFKLSPPIAYEQIKPHKQEASSKQSPELIQHSPENADKKAMALESQPTSPVEPVKPALALEPKLEPKFESKTEIKPEPVSELTPEPESKSKFKSEPEPKPESESEPKSVISQQSVPETVDHTALWSKAISDVALGGMAQTVMNHCVLLEKTDKKLKLGVEYAYQAMLTPNIQARIETALKAYWGEELTLKFDLAQDFAKTPAKLNSEAQQRALDEAERALDTDGCFQGIMEQFDGKLVAGSVKKRDEA